MGTADPPAAVVQRLQEEHLRKDVIGFGSRARPWRRRAAAPRRPRKPLTMRSRAAPPACRRTYKELMRTTAAPTPCALRGEKGDRQRAQELYERGLSVHPTCPTCLGNLPLFLQSCKRPSMKIEAAYKAYFDAYPESVAVVLVKYANFLRHAPGPRPRAETSSRRPSA